MGKGTWNSEWLKQLAVAVGYALVYFAEHPFSHAHFILGSGVRLVFLLLLPYRYWPALVVGELLPNAYEVFPCLDSFGPAWVAVRSIPPITLAMPIVWLCRSRLALFPTKQLVDVKTLLLCVLASSAAWTAYSYIALCLVHVKSGSFTPLPQMAVGYFIGNYFAILAVVPWALIARFNYHTGQWRDLIRQIVASRLSLDAAALLVPTLVILGWVSTKGTVEVRQVVLMSMFLPIAWLTLKHGWRAAAVGGTVASICAAIVLPIRADLDVIVTEIFLAVTITCLFALGARISAQLMQADDETRDVVSVQRLARRNFQLGEQRVRQASQALEHLAGTLHVTNGKLLEYIQRVMPHVESQSYYKKAMTTQNQIYRLAESLHPVAWRERGLPAALNETIARALDEAGIAYRCTITGRGFSRINAAVLVAVYRLACEAVVFVSARLPCTSIRLVLRGGETNGTRWVFLCVEGSMNVTDVADAIRHSTERQRLAGKLGASALDVGEMLDHARIFDGDLHLRTQDERVRISVLLHDVAQEARRLARASAPLRLWVK